MIVEYSRPKTISEAIALLSRNDPVSLPLGGGSVLSKQHGKPVAVVDLQDLGLSIIKHESGKTSIGATATLSQVEEFFKEPSVTSAIQIQAGRNQRNTGTIAGLIASADGRSAFLTLLLAMDAQIKWEPGEKQISLGNWLPLREHWKEALLITEVNLPEVKIRFESIGRTPKDLPIICCAVALWPSGRLRAAVGGFGSIPTLVLDGMKYDDIGKATAQVLNEAGDQWASAAYRLEAGQRIAKRLLFEITQPDETRLS